MSESIIIHDGLTITPDLLQFEVSRSGGPGGQHVNKTSTRVRLRFDIARCEALSEATKEAIARSHPGKLTNEGSLLLVCDTYRSQARNMAEVRDRLATLLRDALKPKVPRKKSRPTKGSREKRLGAKRHRGDLKQSRNRVRNDED